jgi:hypothetical protein
MNEMQGSHVAKVEFDEAQKLADYASISQRPCISVAKRAARDTNSRESGSPLLTSCGA